MHRSPAGRAPGSHEPLGVADVHVWLLSAPEDADDARAARALALLDAAERARLERFRDGDDARRCLLAHALARTTLTRYAPEVPPDRWRFEVNAHGRPEIAGRPTPLRFNLSHTAGLVACAVALGRDVGVDVEHLFPPRFDAQACLEIAAAHFAPSEVADLSAAAPEGRRALFFELWTLKEAYVKARGLGLALPLACVAFDAIAPETRARFEPGVDDAAEWHFTRLRPTPRHALALAVRRARGETLAVRVCEARADSLHDD
jgi:4'-phosphopantetheinyl transferase